MDFLEQLDQGVLTWLQAHQTPWLTTAMLGVTFLGERGTLLVVVVVAGFSRLYLGVHYLSDVAAGWAGGLGCALLAAWLQDWWAAREESPLR
jgi:membrane-associated phospholipid phosphatase